MPGFNTDPLAGRIGCELDTTGAIVVDSDGRTSVSGVFAAGDATGDRRAVVLAAAAGARAGYVIGGELARGVAPVAAHGARAQTAWPSSSCGAAAACTRSWIAARTEAARCTRAPAASTATARSPARVTAAHSARRVGRKGTATSPQPTNEVRSRDLQGLYGERLMGLEPTTFCMARSRAAAAVTSPRRRFPLVG
jgi:Pyridine nucleotide-disulphide oxidoreductase